MTQIPLEPPDDSEPSEQQCMYLQSLRLKNFRSCLDTTVEFSSSLTLLVGENNSGKSNIIEALRLGTTPLGRRRTRYFEEEDISHGQGEEGIEIHAEFDGLSDIQRGQYVTALDLTTSRARYTTRFAVKADQESRPKPTYHAGPLAGPDAEPEKREQVTHVYLAPLRDAQRELDSASGNRLAAIIELLTTKDQRDKFVGEVNSQFKDLKKHAVLQDAGDSVGAHLGEMSRPVREQRVGIDFEGYELRRLARSLRLKMAEEGVELADLAESGLGYANLLFIATVILELQNAKEAELTLFLVEEPEAHLHPQLQAVLLDYLQERASQSGRDDSQGPAGRIQVIATTHSPNLASSIGVENVVVVRSETLPAAPQESSAQPRLARHVTKTVPVARIGLDEDERRKVNQYIDATRAALLFARRVILVEGIGEAVLLPVLTRRCIFGAESDHEQRRNFRGVTVIAVGSVDFKPYIKLLLGAVNGYRVLDRLVVITDADPKVDKGIDDAETADEINRKSQLEDFAREIGAASQLMVYESSYTLEADLLEAGRSNAEVLRDAYLKQHSRSAKHWDEIVSSDNPAEAFHRKLRKNSKFIGKGQFAHDVAASIEAGRPFVCPDYLSQAVRAALDLDGA